MATAQTATITTETTQLDAAGGTVTFAVNFDRQGQTLTSVGFEIDQPSGWSYVTTGAEIRDQIYPEWRPETRPAANETTSTLGFAYQNNVTSFTETFGFTAEIRYPADIAYDQFINARLIYSVEGGSGQQTVQMDQITLSAPPSPPSFNLQPESQTVNEGSFVNFYVGVDGNPTPTYQWFKDGSPISGATDISFEITTVTLADAGVYTLVATNTAGSATSDPATITVLTGPAISDQPDSQTVNEGSDVSFSIVASGSQPLSYQWRKNGVNIPGATSFTLQIDDVDASDAADYDVVVTNDVSSVTSDEATLTVLVPPSITVQPQPQTVTAGESVTFYISADGTEPLEFRWMFNGEDINDPAATDSTYQIDNVQVGDAGSYAVRVTNAAGSDVSDPAALTVQHAPIIDDQPEDQTTGVNGEVTFEVSAYGNPEITTYQWYETSASGGTPTPVGTNDADLVLSNLQLSDNGKTYHVDITNSIGTTTSASATLTVNQGPAFTLHPMDVAVTEDGNVTLTVTVTGNPEPTLQWQYAPGEDGSMSDLPGETGTSLTISAIDRSQAGYYQAVATNSIGSVESDEAMVDVQYAPEITQDLQDQAAGVGGSVTFNVEGEANPEPTFVWYRNGSPISGADEGELTLDNLTLDDDGDTFYLEIDNGIGGTVTSRTATLTVNEQAQITSDPMSATVTEGDPVRFSVEFTGNPTPTVQWQLGGQNIPGATSATYAIDAVSRTQSGEYTAVVTNEFGADTSEAAVLDVQFAPEITRDLTDVTANVGATIVLNVEGEANPEPTFQWYRDGKAIPGATDGDLSLMDLTLDDSGATFYLTADNGIGSGVQSATATLTVVQPPSITTQPVGATLDTGASHTMSIEVEGIPTPTVQWFLNGSAISGATSLSYTISGAAADDGGSYTAVVTNDGGSATSDVAEVVVNTPPVITSQPTGASRIVGQSFSTAVVATGLQPLTYQWSVDGSAIAGATSATFSIDEITEDDGGSYTVTVTNRLGSVTSAAAVLDVSLELSAPTITQQPRDVSARTGADVTLSVTAEGNPVPTYQWRKNGAAIAGATSASLSLSAVEDSDAGAYDVVVANSQGSVSSNLVRVAVTSTDEAPVITSQPRDRTVGAETSVIFSVAATGVPEPTFQWRKNGVAIAGATGTSLTFASVSLADAGIFSVEVTNSEGSVTSRNAQLTVLAEVYAGTYFGSFGEGRGSFAIVIKSDNTGTFLGFDQIAGLYVSGTVSVNDAGEFSLTVTSRTPVSPAASNALRDGSIEVTLPALAGAEVTISGSIGEDGSVAGSVEGVDGLSMSGTKEEGTATEGAAGFYQAGATGSDAVTYTIISPNGKVLVFTETPDGADAGVGTVNGEGQVNVTTVAGSTLTATVAANTSTIQAEVTDSTGKKTTFAGGNEDVIATQRLVNISSRASAGAGEDRTIAGLVISGEDSKPVLIRAVGPGLTEFGVTGVLAQPKLELFSGQDVIASNSGWAASADADEIAAAANIAGAFALDTANADAALLRTLAPGAYTAQVTGADGGSGVVLVEVYDLSSPSLGQKLFNISTRANAGSGNETVVAGFVVSGSVPKRVLLRGVGPTLASYGVNDALSDPRITLFRDTTQVATNDDWGTNAEAVTAASSTTGAFQLAEGSKDAALVLNLEPGAYTLHLNGVGGATGVSLIEVYEVP